MATAAACLLPAFTPMCRADRKKPPEPQPAQTYILDALVTDPAGHPVSDLTAADFELAVGGQPYPIAQASHASAPDRLIVLVDDLNLPETSIPAIRAGLTRLIDTSPAPNDEVVILRTSSGRGSSERFTSDKPALQAAIARIQPYPGDPPPEHRFCSGTANALRIVLEGLRAVPGLKSVVLISAPPAPSLCTGEPSSSWRDLANDAAAVFYLVRPAPAAAPPLLDELVADTGGIALHQPDVAAALDQIALARAARYEVSFSGGSATAPDATLRVKRPGLTVRARHGLLLAPVPNTGLLELPETPPTLARAMHLPFATGNLRVWTSALWFRSQQGTPSLEIPVQVDARDLSFTTSLTGFHNGGFSISAAAFGPDGESVNSIKRDVHLHLTEPQYQEVRRDGVLLSLILAMLHPGGYMVRTVASDDSSGAMGSAAQFVEIPEPSPGKLLVSGLGLWRPAGAAPKEDARRGPVTGAFHPGDKLYFDLSVYNLTVQDGKEQIAWRSHTFYDDGDDFSSVPNRLDFKPGAEASFRGTLTIAEDAKPGHYTLEVTVEDLLAPAASPRAATVYTDFEVVAP